MNRFLTAGLLGAAQVLGLAACGSAPASVPANAPVLTVPPGAAQALAASPLTGGATPVVAAPAAAAALATTLAGRVGDTLVLHGETDDAADVTPVAVELLEVGRYEAGTPAVDVAPAGYGFDDVYLPTMFIIVFRLRPEVSASCRIEAPAR